MFSYGKVHLFCLFLFEQHARIVNKLSSLNPLETRKSLLPFLSCSISLLKIYNFSAHDQ